MDKIEQENICLNCLGALGSERVCLSCGKKDHGASSPSHHLRPRTVLNKKYLIIKSLGEGGFGITYVAWDLTTKQKVAIKEFFPAGKVTRDEKNNSVSASSRYSAAFADGLTRFVDEAQILSKIKKLDGIVAVNDFFSENNTAYIVMEFLDGISLKKYIERKKTLPPQDALTILRPIIASLREVHEMGLLHRDISPDNIIITRRNKVKLIDFGAAKRADGNVAAVILKQGFAPIEQYSGNSGCGPYTDIYALGITLYFCMTGIVPDPAPERAKKDNLTPLPDLFPDADRQMLDAVMKAIAINPEDRYQSASEMELALYGSVTKHKSAGTNKTKLMTTTIAINEKDATISVKRAERPDIPVKQRNLFGRILDWLKKD